MQGVFMAGLGWDGSNPDVGLLFDVNGMARHAPHWIDRFVAVSGSYGCAAAVAVVAVAGWFVARRRPDAPAAVAGVVWAVLSAGVAVLLDIPVRGFVHRPRPSVTHHGLDVLAHGGGASSFASDQAALTMAVAVGLFLVSRGLGAVAGGLAVVQGFASVYAGVHYPSDVVGGFALGTATALLLAPAAMALLTRLGKVVARSRLRPLVAAPARSQRREAGLHPKRVGEDTDLAA
jgi:undecaprenyl-diphosphatase